MSETESPLRNRALVASFLFTDLVGYSKGSAAEQYAEKAALSEILSKHLAALRKEDYRIKDTGDGALIAFLTSPEHALYVALAIGQEFAQTARSAGFGSNSLRTGLHIGAVKEAIDLEARPNFVGDGINAAKRIMDFAAPGQITASRAYFEAVSWLDASYAALFQHLGASDDKHGRAHDLYAISPNAAVQEKLGQDFASAARANAEPDPVSPPPMAKRGSSSPAVAGTGGASGRAAEGVRRWLAPIGVAIVAAAVLTLVYPSLRTPPPMAVPAPAVAGDAASSASRNAIPGAPSAATVPPAAPPLTPPLAPEPASNGVAASALPSPGADGASAPTVARPAPAVPSAPTVSGVDARRRTVEAPPMPGAAPSGATSVRCQHIMEKATLGEALSQEEKRELVSSCR